MEHEGRIWFGDDDPSSVTQATLEVTSDNRVVVYVGGALTAEWALDDVDVIGDHPVTEFHIGDDIIHFEPTDPEALKGDIVAARMRVRLQRSAGQEQVPSGSVSDSDPETALVATTAGARSATAGSYCRACGDPIDLRAEICVHCGVRQYSVSIRPHKSKTTAGLLALFLGGFGAHHFYLGQIGLGILYLLFFWTFIPAIVAFFEALVFFFQSDASFDAKYNSVLISL